MRKSPWTRPDVAPVESSAGMLWRNQSTSSNIFGFLSGLPSFVEAKYCLNHLSIWKFKIVNHYENNQSRNWSTNLSLAVVSAPTVFVKTNRVHISRVKRSQGFGGCTIDRSSSPWCYILIQNQWNTHTHVTSKAKQTDINIHIRDCNLTGNLGSTKILPSMNSIM